MIKLDSLSFQKGDKQLLELADLTIHAGWRVGLIGDNGSGKTSFLGLLKNPSLADEGLCRLPKDWVISHLEQEVLEQSRVALDYVLDGHTIYRDIETRIQQAQNDLEQDNNHTQLAELLGHYEAMGGYQVASQAAILLSGLGFSESDQQRPMSDFSGGWRIRLNLAKALMCPSDLLLLDEPTNHLDLDSILWLEKWLRSYTGTLLIISHDREFLDQSVDHVVHFNQKKLDVYKGNYSQFEVERSKNAQLQQAQYEKQQTQIAHMEDFVRRFKAKASKAKQAQSRVKALEKMEKILPAHIASPFTFDFFNHEQLPDSLVRLEKVRLGYDNTTVLDHVELELGPESRLGVLGLNGAGKSTLLKGLIGEQALLSGERSINEKMRLGYFSQHQLEALDLQASPMIHVFRLAASLAVNITEQEVRNFLGGFGFHGDRVNETIQHFSGGEKSRLSLALICWTRPNLLILDEPTNHLDMEMRHALTLALQNFNGALVVVSHDRHLIRCTTDSLVLLNNGRVENFEGDIDNYSSYLDKEPSEELSNISEASRADANDLVSKKERKRSEAELRAKLSPFKQALKKLEQSMSKLTEEKQSIEDKLADSQMYDEENKQQLKSLLLKQSQLKQSLIQDEEKWLELSDELETLMQEKNHD